MRTTKRTRISSTSNRDGDSIRKRSRANEGHNSMPTFARRPMTMSSLFPVDIPQNSMVGQQRQQISELQFDKFPTPSSFLLEDPIHKTIDYLF